MTPVEKESLLKVSECFSKGFGNLTLIDYEKDRYIFWIDNDTFAVVYSLDNEEPEYMSQNDSEELSYYVEKLDEHWYSITGTY
jgi:hypothetical protein